MGLHSLHVRGSEVHSFSLISIRVDQGRSIRWASSHNLLKFHFNLSNFNPISLFQRDLFTLAEYLPDEIILITFFSLEHLLDADLVMFSAGYTVQGLATKS